MGKISLLIVVMFGLLTCAISQTANISKPSTQSLTKGKGTLSFKMNGQLFKTDSTETKCWTSSNVSIAMLWAKGANISISWQIQHFNDMGAYRVDNDSKGKLNFTLQGKTYWIRDVDGSNYLNIRITGVKEKYNVKLLSGTFEGVLADKDGNKVRITEGVFVTSDI
jgi:hypothetical protein